MNDKPNKKIARIHPSVLRQINKANDLDWNRTYPLKIEYGQDPTIIATGAIYKNLTEELIRARLLRIDQDGVLSLNIRKKSLTAEDVTAHIQKIEAYCIAQNHIKGLRGERLHLGDKLVESHRQHYASYDRNLDVLGFMVHSVCVVTYQLGGEQNGHLVLAKRNPVIMTVNEDSKWNLLSGAITHGATAHETRVSEGVDEYGLTATQMRRARPVGVITTNRTRGNPYSIVRETVRVSSLGLSSTEIERLACQDFKTITVSNETGIENRFTVKANSAFVVVSPEKIKAKLKKKKHLKNGKALSMLLFLSSQNHIRPDDPLAADLADGLLPKARTYCRVKPGWIKPAPTKPGARRVSPSPHLVL